LSTPVLLNLLVFVFLFEKNFLHEGRVSYFFSGLQTFKHFVLHFLLLESFFPSRRCQCRFVFQYLSYSMTVLTVHGLLQTVMKTRASISVYHILIGNVECFYTKTITELFYSLFLHFLH